MKIRQCPLLRFPLCNLIPGRFKPAPLESSLGILLWLCGGANFAAEQALLLLRSARVALFLTSYLHMTVNSNASRGFHIADEQFQRKNSNNSDIHGHPSSSGIDSPCKDD